MENQKLKLVGANIINFSSIWCVVPEDLLEQIIEKLCFRDQVRFHAVCKPWHAVDKYKKAPSYSLPWLCSVQKVGDDILEYRFFEPSNLDPVTVNTINLKQYGTDLPNAEEEYTSTACKYGWLFFSILVRYRYCNNYRSMFLLSLFTKKVIQLPNLVPRSYNGSKALKAVSAEPDSPDCVFLVLHDCDFHEIMISTVRHGDKKWTSRKYFVDSFYICFRSTPVYFRGIFYFVSTKEDVASYNVADGKLNIERWKTDEYSLMSNLQYYKFYELFELNGELVLIYFESEKSGFIRKLDWANKSWILSESLGDQALFFSSNTFLVSTFGKEARDNGVLPNKIYRFVDSGCIVYSLEKGKLVRFKKCSGITNWINDTNYYRKFALWIEPPNHRKSVRKLEEKQTVLHVITKPCMYGRKNEMAEKLGNGLLNLLTLQNRINKRVNKRVIQRRFGVNSIMGVQVRRELGMRCLSYDNNSKSLNYFSY